MRVLHLVSVATMTGPADPALSLAAAQRRLAGIDAVIAYDRVRAGDMPVKTEALGVPVIEELSLCTKGGLGRALADRRSLARLGRDFDVVHAHSTHDHGLAALAGLPFLVRSIHHPRSLARRLAQGLLFERTRGFFVPAEAHRALLLERYPEIDPARVELVRGAIDPEVYRPGLDGAAFRRALGVPEGATVVGMIARFQPGRRQGVLIEAIARARRDHGVELFLALIGKGETQAEIEALIARHGLTGASRLYGFRGADLPEAIASCDMTVLLQQGSDAGCRAVLQSLACGVPVIGARLPAIEEALEGVGSLVAGDDPAELAARIVALAERLPRERAAISAASRARAIERYTEATRVEAVSRAYARWAGA